MSRLLCSHYNNNNVASLPFYYNVYLRTWCIDEECSAVYDASTIKHFMNHLTLHCAVYTVVCVIVINEMELIFIFLVLDVDLVIVDCGFVRIAWHPLCSIDI